MIITRERSVMLETLCENMSERFVLLAPLDCYRQEVRDVGIPKIKVEYVLVSYSL